MSRWLESHRSEFDAIMTLPVGVAQAANEQLMDALRGFGELEVLRFPSDSEVNGWVVPRDCVVEAATIRRHGKIAFDGTQHPLALIASSTSFVGSISKSQLDQHVYFSQQRPDAFAFHCTNNYRPWAGDWGFCIPYSDYVTWPDGEYDIDLRTTFRSGDMLVGVLELPGERDEVVVLNAHTCHPCQFEDGFSGIAAILEVLERLSRLPERRFTYRAVFAPEHIGTVFYLNSLSESERSRIKGAIFTEMIGLQQPLAVQKTFTGSHLLDRIAVAEALEAEPGCRIGDFRTIVGNDETVWEAPGYEIPCISISRCFESPHYYPEYHTSDDQVDKSDFTRREGAVDLIERMLMVLERDAVPRRKFTGLIALSNPKYDLYVPRPDPTVPQELSRLQLRLGAAQDRVLRYLDGNLTVFEVSELLNLPFGLVLEYLERFEAKGLIELLPAVGSRSLLRPTSASVGWTNSA